MSKLELDLNGDELYLLMGAFKLAIRKSRLKYFRDLKDKIRDEIKKQVGLTFE